MHLKYLKVTSVKKMTTFENIVSEAQIKTWKSHVLDIFKFSYFLPFIKAAVS